MPAASHRIWIRAIVLCAVTGLILAGVIVGARRYAASRGPRATGPGLNASSAERLPSPPPLPPLADGFVEDGVFKIFSPSDDEPEGVASTWSLVLPADQPSRTQTLRATRRGSQVVWSVVERCVPSGLCGAGEILRDDALNLIDLKLTSARPPLGTEEVLKVQREGADWIEDVEEHATRPIQVQAHDDSLRPVKAGEAFRTERIPLRGPGAVYRPDTAWGVAPLCSATARRRASSGLRNLSIAAREAPPLLRLRPEPLTLVAPTRGLALWRLDDVLPVRILCLDDRLLAFSTPGRWVVREGYEKWLRAIPTELSHGAESSPAEAEQIAELFVKLGDSTPEICGALFNTLRATYDAPGAESTAALEMLVSCALRHRQYPAMEWAARRWLVAPEPGQDRLLARPDQVLTALRLQRRPQETIDLAVTQEWIERYRGTLLVESEVLDAGCDNAPAADCARNSRDVLRIYATHLKDAHASYRISVLEHLARSELRLGRFAAVAATLARLSKEDAALTPNLAGIKEELAEAKRTGLQVTVKVPSRLPLGTYHWQLKGLETVPAVADVTIVSLRPGTRALSVHAELRPISIGIIGDFKLAQGKDIHYTLSPELRPEFSVAGLKDETPGTVVVTVFERGKSIWQAAYSVTLLPRAILPLYEGGGETEARTTFENVAAWVTPNDRAIEAFLSAAKKRLPAGHAFSGTQSLTRPQVQALWDELQSRGLSYVNDPTVFSPTGHAQRTRLPADVLGSTNAQCLESTVLFASLLEAIGLETQLIILPTHALVAWQTSEAEGGKFLPFETVMDPTLSFDGAVARGQAVVEEVLAMQGAGAISALRLSELRQRGLTPQPW